MDEEAEYEGQYMKNSLKECEVLFNNDEIFENKIGAQNETLEEERRDSSRRRSRSRCRRREGREPERLEARRDREGDEDAEGSEGVCRPDLGVGRMSLLPRGLEGPLPWASPSDPGRGCPVMLATFRCRDDCLNRVRPIMLAIFRCRAGRSATSRINSDAPVRQGDDGRVGAVEKSGTRCEKMEKMSSRVHKTEEMKKEDVLQAAQDLGARPCPRTLPRTECPEATPSSQGCRGVFDSEVEWQSEQVDGQRERPRAKSRPDSKAPPPGLQVQVSAPEIEKWLALVHLRPG
jgi:hypothetical protein